MPLEAAACAHNPYVSGFTDFYIHDRFSEGFHRFLLNTHIKQTDDLTRIGSNRFISSKIPGVYNVRPAPESVPVHDGGDNRIRGSIRIYSRNVGSDGTGCVQLFYICGDPEHISLVVYLLEYRTGSTDQAFNRVDYRCLP